MIRAKLCDHIFKTSFPHSFRCRPESPLLLSSFRPWAAGGRRGVFGKAVLASIDWIGWGLIAALITRRSEVRIFLPQPLGKPGYSLE